MKQEFLAVPSDMARDYERFLLEEIARVLGIDVEMLRASALRASEDQKFTAHRAQVIAMMSQPPAMPRGVR